jgi:mannosyltransferase
MGPSSAPNIRHAAKRSKVVQLTPEITAGILALVVFGWSVRAADPWQDELVTLIVASRPITTIIKTALHIDVVHALYYVLAHPFLMLDQSIVTVRLVSVTAMAVTAVVLVRIGRVLSGWPVGLGAGLMLIVSVAASRYAQEARSYALVAMLAALSTLALIRAIGNPLARRGWAMYSALVVAAGLFNIMSVLIVPAHALWLCYSSATRRAAIITRWGVSIVASGAALAPFAFLARRQIGQVGWITAPGLTELTGIAELGWVPGYLVILVLLITAVTVGIRGTPGARTAFALGLSWGVLPPLLLLIVSQIHPLYEPRYVLFAVPGMALAMGSLAGLRFAQRWSPAAAVAIVLIPAVTLGLAGLPEQRAQRLPEGHGQDLRGISQILWSRSRPGDGVVFLPYFLRVMKAGFPLPDRVGDVTLASAGPSDAAASGWQVTPGHATMRLNMSCRVWVVTKPGNLIGRGPTDDAVIQNLLARFDQVDTYSVRGFDLLLFTSRDPFCGSGR